MPDYNADREFGKGKIKYAVRYAHPGTPPESIVTGRGIRKLDRKGRCLISDHGEAAEIRKEHPHDLAVSRIFTNDPADRGHIYHFGQNPIAFDENGNRIFEESEAKEKPEAQVEKELEHE